MTRQIKSSCCYCGVGCGVLIETENNKIIGVRGMARESEMRNLL